jgi:hypothetical protein
MATKKHAIPARNITIMKLPNNKLKMSNGSIRKFASAEKRDRFEKAARLFKENPMVAKKLYGR